VKKYKDHTLTQYLDVLSQRTPTPGGGSASALTGACACALLCMVTNYSVGKGQPKAIEKKLVSTLEQAQAYRQRFLELVDLDAEAYLKVVQARKGTKQEQNAAQKAANKVPKEIRSLSYKAIGLALFLARYGNKNLVSDVGVASDMLLASYNGAMTLLDS
jgi:formiminotetrahydrofolate cyclodeaminase